MKLKKLLFKLVDYPLYPPTGDEIKLLDEYKLKFNKMNNSNYNMSKDWSRNINRLKELANKDDLRCFLRWDVIQRTMFVSYSHYIIREFIYLRQLKNWKNQWQETIKESYAGYPIHFLFY